MNNLENNRRIITNSSYLYIRTFFILLLNLYISRLILDELGIVDYGIYSVVASVIIMSGFLNDAMAVATQRFLSFKMGKKRTKQLKKFFQTSLAIHLFIGLIVLVLAETLGLWFVNTQINYPPEKSLAVTWLYQISILTFLISIVQVPFRASLISNEHFKAFSFLHVAEVILKLGAVLMLGFIAEEKLIAYGLLLFVVMLIVSIAYMVYANSHFEEISFQYNYDKTISKTLLSYTSWTLFGNVAYIGSSQGINILLNLFFTPVVNASMAIAMQVQNAVRSFVYNIQIAINPPIIKSYADNQLVYMKMLIFAGAKYSFFFLLLFSFPILIETEFILEIWLKEVPAFAITFTRLLLITVLIDSFSGSLMTAFHATGKIKRYQLVVGCTLLLNLPISYIFLKFGFNPEVVMFVAISLSLLALFLRLVMLRKILEFSASDFLMQVMLRAIGVSVLTSLSIFFIQGMEMGFKRLLLLILVELILISVAIWFVGLRKNEKRTLINGIKKYRKH